MKKMRKNSILDFIIKELWEVRNPHQKDNKLAYKLFKEKLFSLFKYERVGNKLWTKPSLKKASFELSTARNRNLISIDEQNELRQTTVAFFGLSVGSHAALTWM